MPKRAASNDSVVADSEEERKKTVKSPKKGAANGKVDDPPTSGDESGAAEEDEGVYEIEAILDHQRVKVMRFASRPACESDAPSRASWSISSSGKATTTSRTPGNQRRTQSAHAPPLMRSLAEALVFRCAGARRT